MKNKLFSFLIVCPMLFAVLFSFVLGTSSFMFADTIPTEIKVISDTAEVYETADTTSTVIKTALFSEKYEVVDISGDFYEIEITTTQNGLIQTAFCMDSSFKPIESILDTNAIITRESNVYIKYGTQYTQVSGITLSENTRVKLLSGADGTSEYSFITFSADGELLTYYVLSDNIDADGFPLRTLIALMLIVTCVALFLIIYTFYKNKKNQAK